MFTITRAKSAGGKAGEPLPTVFKTLGANTVHIRRGQFTLIAAAPGVGKSLLSLTLAVKAGVPTFYFSPDTDQFTTYIRSASLVTGHRMEDIEQAVGNGHVEAYDAKLDGSLNHVRFFFEGGPSFDDVDEELMAFATTYGEWPHAIFVDNLADLWTGEAEGTTRLEAACDYLKQLAKKTGAAVVALHHVTGYYDDGTQAVPLSGLKGKISKIPEVVLTLHRPSLTLTPTLNVCPVKNRTGKADPSGNWFLPLAMDPDVMKLEG